MFFYYYSFDITSLTSGLFYKYYWYIIDKIISNHYGFYDRKNLGRSLSAGKSTKETTIRVWKMAVKNRNIEKGLVFNSDRGVQYASKRYLNALGSYKKITNIHSLSN